MTVVTLCLSSAGTVFDMSLGNQTRIIVDIAKMKIAKLASAYRGSLRQCENRIVVAILAPEMCETEFHGSNGCRLR